jgi:hypothetical protein
MQTAGCNTLYEASGGLDSIIFSGGPSFLALMIDPETERWRRSIGNNALMSSAINGVIR